MTTIRYDNGAYFAFSPSPQHAGALAELGWRRHAHDLSVWWTRSPYLAAPLYAHAEPGETQTALAPYAWNYETSFAKGPIAGTGVDAIRLPIGQSPYPFQVAGVQRAVLRKKVLIADQMGLGKTIQALALMNLVRPRRTVIGCPTFLTKNWASECNSWLVDAQPITILDGGRKSLPDRGIIILPYSRGHTFFEQINAGPPVDLVILDEVHFLKDSNARRSKPWFGEHGLARRADRVVALSGTPMPNNPLELYGLLSVLAPDLLAGVTHDAFKELYCTTIPLKKKVDLKRGGQKAIEVEKITAKGQAMLNAELRASGVMLRREKEHVLTQLPAKSVYFVHMTPDAEIETLVREESDLYDQLQMRILTSQELMSLRGHVATVRARLGLLKAPKIAEYVRWIFDSGEDRVVLFMLHLEAIEAVRAAFAGSGIDTLVMTGAESTTVRDQRVRDFQTPGRRKLVIGQMTAAGVGTTMTAARYCVLGEINWTPAWNDQAIDRVHRIGQAKSVMAPVLTFPAAVEERVIRAGARKSLDAREVLDVNLAHLFLDEPSQGMLRVAAE
jgi:SWI/SNF-related matrix-associated actin-dependent regulator of chromatin subfamily A-like protein 1